MPAEPGFCQMTSPRAMQVREGGHMMRSSSLARSGSGFFTLRSMPPLDRLAISPRSSSPLPPSSMRIDTAMPIDTLTCFRFSIDFRFSGVGAAPKRSALRAPAPRLGILRQVDGDLGDDRRVVAGADVGQYPTAGRRQRAAGEDVVQPPPVVLPPLVP